MQGPCQALGGEVDEEALSDLVVRDDPRGGHGVDVGIDQDEDGPPSRAGPELAVVCRLGLERIGKEGNLVSKYKVTMAARACLVLSKVKIS